MFWNRPKKEEPTEIKMDEKPENKMLDLSSLDEACDQAIRNVIDRAVQVKAPSPKKADGSAMDSISAQMSISQSSGYVNQRTLAFYIASSSFIGYQACALIAQHWLVSKGCSLKAREAVKKWFSLSTNDGSNLTPEQIKFIEKQDKKYKLKQNLIQAVHFKNVFGIRHILFKHKNPDFDYSKPFNPDGFGMGEYAGMSQIDPYWITPEISDDDLSDPTSIGFYEPTYWIIGNKRYHKSHFVILIGDEVADYLKPSYRYGGISLVQQVYERVYASESTANEAPQLAKTKRLLVQKVDAAKVQSNMAQFIKGLNVFQKMRDNYGTKFIGKEDEVQQIDTNLADLDSVIMTNYQLVCSVFGDPASKLLGVGHSGFSTGETDDDYWIQSVEEIQSNDMSQIVDAHYARLLPSSLRASANIESQIEPVWNPIKVMSENENADVLTKVSTSLANLVNTGAIDAIDVQQYLEKQKNLGFEGLSERANESDEDFADEE